MDKITGRSRGSGFVCYWKTESANAAMEESRKVAQETGANSMPVSRACPDECACLLIIPARWRQEPFCPPIYPYCRPFIFAHQPVGSAWEDTGCRSGGNEGGGWTDEGGR
jgi:RNA recognition motif-containing protein